MKGTPKNVIASDSETIQNVYFQWKCCEMGENF